MPPKKTPRKRHRLAHGEGSFYHRAKDDLWIGSICVGTTSRGTLRRVTVSDKNEDQAWDKLQAKRKAIMIGEADATITLGTTVNAWAKEWLAAHKQAVRPNTYRTDAGAITKWVLPLLGRKQIRHLTARDVRTLGQSILDAGRTSTTARHCQMKFQQMLRDAKAEGITVPDPPVLAKLLPRAVSDRDALELDEALAVLEVVASRPDGSRWAAALLQGMRQGECLGLTWDHVDLDAGTVTISWQLQQLTYADRAKGTFNLPADFEAIQLEGRMHLTRPKTRSGWRVIPLVPWMATALKRWREIAPASPHNLVWPNADGSPRDPKDDLQAFRDLQAAANVRKAGTEDDPYYYVLHEARHTTATLLLELGVDPEVIKAILGHSSIVTTRGYQHVNQELTRRALEKVAAKLQLES